MSDELNLPALLTSARSGFSYGLANARGFFLFLKAVLLLALRSAAFGPDLLLRYGHGERYLSLLLLILHIIAVLYVVPVGSLLRTLYIAVVALVFITHCVLGHVRRKHGVLKHSYSHGDVSYPLPQRIRLPLGWSIPVPFRKQDDWQLRSLLEPLAVFVTGFFLSHVSPLGVFLLLAALGMFLRCLVEHRAFRSAVLDAVDQRLEAQNFAGVMREKLTPRQADGFTVPAPGSISDAEKHLLAAVKVTPTNAQSATV